MALLGLRMTLLSSAMLLLLVVSQLDGSIAAKSCVSLLTLPPVRTGVLDVVLGDGATTFNGPEGVYELVCRDKSKYLNGTSRVTCENGKWQPDPYYLDCTICNEKQLGRKKVTNDTHGVSCICDHLRSDTCDQPGKVCGTDARTYDSKCHLEFTRCEEGRLIDIASLGPCRFGGVCALSKPFGDCNAYEKRWYYNLRQTRCEQFDYGQCFTGRNVFDTKHECYKHCECDVWCKQPCEPGPCKHTPTTERFYFEQEIDTCKSMRYSECGGNENNFGSHSDCMTACQYQRNSPALSQTCLNRHKTTLDQACESPYRNGSTFLVTISVDSDEVERFGYHGYIIMVWHKFFGNDRVVTDNQEFLVNLSERCPCLSLLKGEQYLVSGVVKSNRLTIHDGSLIKPYTSFVDLKANVNLNRRCR